MLKSKSYVSKTLAGTRQTQDTVAPVSKSDVSETKPEQLSVCRDIRNWKVIVLNYTEFALLNLYFWNKNYVESANNKS